ncbi:hypothetical protein M011DRAFT_195290 [Sporormia fimetaria CBS 119925]|uniref:Uncharacterized protein n=1 Tax=Sporormia fimetaria CBS 119925 TaxID=1340428 RepID=A0A6A6V339_9PLEO|nr:hypothetical protein M011DRAFT_195290 [Sporormia fimetaria CBS 119925]
MAQSGSLEEAEREVGSFVGFCQEYLQTEPYLDAVILPRYLNVALPKTSGLVRGIFGLLFFLSLVVSFVVTRFRNRSTRRVASSFRGHW